MLLGIDASTTNTAIVGISNKGEYLFGTLISPKDSDIHVRMLGIFKQVAAILSDSRNWKDVPLAVAIEYSAIRGKGKVVELAELNGSISLTAMQYYEVFRVPPQTLKKFATGNGRASKEDMEKVVPVEVLEDFLQTNEKKIDDLVDAYHLAQYARNKLNEA